MAKQPFYKEIPGRTKRRSLTRDDDRKMSFLWPRNHAERQQQQQQQQTLDSKPLRIAMTKSTSGFVSNIYIFCMQSKPRVESKFRR